MRTNKSVWALVGLLLAVSCPAAIPPAVKLLPQDTLAVLAVPDANSLRSFYSSSPQWQMWQDAAMKKDFDSWNEQKKKLNDREDILLYHERDIRWCQLGINVGFEQDGTGAQRARPVLILKAFSREVCLAVPLTTSKKRNPYHISIGEVAGRDEAVIISQLRLIDTKRLDQKIGFLSKDTFNQIRKAVKGLL